MNPKKNVVAAWILQVMLAAMFLPAGWMKLVGTERVVEGFQKWGYGDGFLYFIGAVEMFGGLALLVPRLAALSAIGLMVVMFGAAYTHLAHDEGFVAAMPAIILIILLAGIVYLRRVALTKLFSIFK